MNLRRLLLPAVLLASFVLPARAADPRPVFVLTDPTGDDYGDGTLKYPARPDLRQGDLGIIELRVEPGNGGVWFSASFARTIRPPGPEPVDAVGTTMASVAKLGFYTFNIDVYIDMDRVPGSGHTNALPGRKVTIDPATAWEKAVCLTPRPDVAQVLLGRLLARDEKAAVRKNKPRVDPEDVKLAGQYAKENLAQQYFFPTRAQVNGHRVRFFVPNSFLGATPKPEWAYTVVVTAADVLGRLDATQLLGKAAAYDGGDLMLIPVGSSPTATQFGGREDDELQPPVIDVIVPEGQKQEDVLKDYDLRDGRMVKLTGVPPR